jgi:hypothetical protein
MAVAKAFHEHCTTPVRTSAYPAGATLRLVVHYKTFRMLCQETGGLSPGGVTDREMAAGESLTLT